MAGYFKTCTANHLFCAVEILLNSSCIFQDIITGSSKGKARLVRNILAASKLFRDVISIIRLIYLLMNKLSRFVAL